jgi:hypothetical protein
MDILIELKSGCSSTAFSRTVDGFFGRDRVHSCLDEARKKRGAMAEQAVDLLSRTALAAVDETPTGANAQRLMIVIRYATESTAC